MRELTKVFEHAKVDPKWYAYWEDLEAFRADPFSDRPPFSMVLPPPNVTGWLHIGHALNQTLPDIMARGSGCRGTTFSGFLAPTTRGSPPRTWSNNN